MAAVRIAAVRYAQQEIAVPYVPDHEATFTKGRTLRVYNRERSALFRIEDARRKDDQLWLSLDHSALVARGPVKETRDGTVVLDAHLTFATGVVKEERLQGIRHEFAGTWMSEVDTARQVKAATTSGTVYLADAIPAETLRSDCGGRVVSIWQYGVGDRVEMARVRCVPPAPTPNGAVQ